MANCAVWMERMGCEHANTYKGGSRDGMQIGGAFWEMAHKIIVRAQDKDLVKRQRTENWTRWCERRLKRTPDDSD